MKFKEYLEELNKLAEENPESLNMDVIYASDDEGNSYHPVIGSGSLVKVEDPTAHYVEIIGMETVDNPNAIIIN